MPSAFASARWLGVGAVAVVALGAHIGCKSDDASDEREASAQQAPPRAAPSSMSRELAQLPGVLEFVETRGEESHLRRMRPSGELLADVSERAHLFPAAGSTPVAIFAPADDNAPERLMVLDSNGPRAVGEPAQQIRNVVVAAHGDFAILESNAQSFRDLYRVDLNDGSQRRLTEDGDGAFDPDLSPDDAFAVFVTTVPGQSDLHVISTDGKKRRSLTETPANEASPDWSPDGRSIAFSGDADGPERIFVMPAGGGAPRRLTDQGAETEHEIDPLWSPRGDRVAYLQDSSAGRTELWVAEWPGGRSWRVSADDGHAKHPQWSGDGRFLWYADDTGSTVGIWAARSDGSERLRLSDSDADQWLPRWRALRDVEVEVGMTELAKEPHPDRQ